MAHFFLLIHDLHIGSERLQPGKGSLNFRPHVVCPEFGSKRCFMPLSEIQTGFADGTRAWCHTQSIRFV
jgi:hypothetical protein